MIGPPYDEDDLLPISLVMHYAYCPRRAGLVLLEREWADSVTTIQGKHLHDKAHGGGPSEARPGVRVARGLRLASRQLGLWGVADVVEFHAIDDDTPSVPLDSGVELPGQPGRWRPYPVEYKRGHRRREMSFMLQACAQGVCLEETLGTNVRRGAIFFGKSGRRLEIEFDEELRQRLILIAQALHVLARQTGTPSAEAGPKCEQCSMVGLCMPKTVSRQNAASRYLQRIVRELAGKEEGD